MNSSPRILFVAPTWPFPPRSGMTAKLARLSSLFPAHTIAVLESQIDDSQANLPIANNSWSVARKAVFAAAHRYPLSGASYSPSAFTDSLAKLADIPDVIHFDTVRTAHLARTAIRHYELRERPVIVLSINDSYELSQSTEGYFRAKWARIVESRVLGAGDVVHVVAQRDATFLRTRGIANVEVVPLICDISPSHFPSLPSREFDISYIGSLNGQWGQSVAKLLSIIRSDFAFSQLRICIAGAQSVPPAIRALARNLDITFAGRVENPAEVFLSSKFAAVPSPQRHGTPTKALEAMACGSVPIGHNALFGLLSDPRSMSLVDESWPELIRGVLALRVDEPNWQILSSAGRRYVEEHHRPARVRDRYLNTLPDRSFLPGK